MAASVIVTISGLSGVVAAELSKEAAQTSDVIASLERILNGIANGTYAATITTTVSTSNAARAAGKVTIASGSGATAATIAGTAVSVTWATSDTNTASLLAAAINANTTVNKLVDATSAAGVVTITAKVPGLQGGQITLTASGTGVTVTGSGKLSGVTTGAGGDGAVTVYNLA